MSDLKLSAEDEVLLESLVLAASDNVARAPASDRDQFAPERRRAFVETSGDENVYLGTGDAWVDVSENTGFVSALLGSDSVNTEDATINRQFGSRTKRLVDSWARDSINPADADYWTIENTGGAAEQQISTSGETGDPYHLSERFNGANDGVVSDASAHDLPYYPEIGDILYVPVYVDSFDDETDVEVCVGVDNDNAYEIRFGTRIGGVSVVSAVNGTASETFLDTVDFTGESNKNFLLTLDMRDDSYRVTLHERDGGSAILRADSDEITSEVQSEAGAYIKLSCFGAGSGSPWDEYRFGPITAERKL